jgi:hypothetical protein
MWSALERRKSAQGPKNRVDTRPARGAAAKICGSGSPRVVLITMSRVGGRSSVELSAAGSPEININRRSTSAKSCSLRELARASRGYSNMRFPRSGSAFCSQRSVRRRLGPVSRVPGRAETIARKPKPSARRHAADLGQVIKALPEAGVTSLERHREGVERGVPTAPAKEMGGHVDRACAGNARAGAQHLMDIC